MLYNSVSTDKQTKTTTTATRLITSSDVLRAIAKLLTIAATYGAQRTASTMRAAHRATIATRQWLKAQHSFFAQDGDPIRCTGYQIVGYNIAAAAAALLLCINF